LKDTLSRGVFLIESKRTYLRRFNIDDFESVYEMESQEDVMKYTGPGKALTKEESKTRLNNIIADKDNTGPLGVWAAVNKSENKVMGWFMLKMTNNDSPELGFMINKRFWGKGYATEICQSLLDYGFNTLNLKSVIAITNNINTGSIKVLEKIGMKHIKDLDNKTKMYQILSKSSV
jgi:RimJ/RimL family protein N-acetyltransferase